MRACIVSDDDMVFQKSQKELPFLYNNSLKTATFLIPPYNIII